jgi:outer membrane protein assembly factor BamB
VIVTVRTVARGKAVARFEAALGLIGLLALGITASIVTGWNPLPHLGDQLQDWLKHTGRLAQPDTAWRKRVGDQPSAAVIAGTSVVVTMPGSIEARSLSTGDVLWHKEADWAAAAGDDATAVAVLGVHGKGLQAVDPATGAVRWKDEGAVGAWTYRDAVLTLSCGSGVSDCTLAGHDPRSGATRWSTVLQGVGRLHAGLNRDLLGSRDLSDTFHDAIEATPEPVPSLIGIPIDNRVQVIDTATGTHLKEQKPNTTTRVVVVGGRVLASTAVPKDGSCRYTLEGRDAASGRVLWHKDGYDLRTASGAGCEQRKDPAGGAAAVVATRGDNREVFLSTRDGHELWVGAAGESIVATDGRYGVVRTADKKTLKLIDLASGHQLWTRAAAPKSSVALMRYGVLVRDLDAGTLKGYDLPRGAPIIDVKTGSDLLGFGPTGVMLGRGRTIGFLHYA